MLLEKISKAINNCMAVIHGQRYCKYCKSLNTQIHKENCPARLLFEARLSIKDKNRHIELQSAKIKRLTKIDQQELKAMQNKLRS